MADTAIVKGDVLQGPAWDEPVEVIAVDSVGSGKLIYAVGKVTQESYPGRILSPEQIDNISVKKQKDNPAFDGDAEQFKQAIEAARIDLASEYDPHHALSASQVDPVPHQLEAVYKYMLEQNQIRFFLADDAGAGKTVMAGLLLKELKQRGIVDNCLILVPAKLRRKWQQELLSLFDEEFRIIRRGHMVDTIGNPWQDHQFCIASMAFAIQDDVRQSLREVQWDLVIVDEAHHLSAYRRGADEEEDKTERYKLGELLRDNSIHRLFLSATPHKGDRDNFQLLLRLIDRDLFAEDQLPREIVHSDDRGTVFLRRMKEDMVDLHGNPLFKDRNVHTVSYEISGDELAFYNDVTEYVENQFQSAWKKDNRNIQFALIVLQRRVASSITAAKHSLRRRKIGLEELLDDVDLLREDQEQNVPDQEDLEEMAERQRWEIEEEALRRLTMSSNREELKNEIRTLEGLVETAGKLEARREEKKLEELRDLLQGRREMTPFSQDEKLVVFTEAKDTLDFLVDRLESWGYELVTIHGGMEMGRGMDPAENSRLWAEDQFNDPDGPQVMVATDAAGEGINLHEACRLMVNYDLPWNPTYLEQRMGRIHRYGQDEPVHIYNLVASNTREGYVLEKLSLKLEQMRHDIGSDRVFDVISELAEGVSLNQLITGVVSGTKDRETADLELDSLDERGEQAVERAAREGLATRHIDLAQVQEWLREDKERRLSPEYIEKFFINSFRLLGGTVEERKDGLWRIEWVPAEIRRVAETGQIREPDTSYTKFTFYKGEADDFDQTDFVAPGHPLFDVVAAKATQEFSGSLPEGSVFVDPGADSPYLLLFIRQKLENGNGTTVSERVFSVGYDSDNGFYNVNEGILHDLRPGYEDVDSAEIQNMQSLYDKKEQSVDWFYDNVVTKYQKSIEQDEREVVDTIRPSMKSALNTAIASINQDIRKLKREKGEGKEVNLPLTKKQQKLEDLIERRDEQLDQLDQRQQVVPTNPTVLGSALVFPASVGEQDGGMSRDEDVELAAMQVTFDYEEENGRTPEDVSQEHLGFDVRSLREAEGGMVEERYIEVKGRAGTGAVALTENEWLMANRLEDDFWLYIVTHATEDPELHRIQNPATEFEPEKREVVRYFVGQEEWDTKTMETEQ